MKKRASIVFFTLLLTFVTAMEVPCADDYWPCSCRAFRIIPNLLQLMANQSINAALPNNNRMVYTEKRVQVTCSRISAMEVSQIFSRNSFNIRRDIYKVEIKFSPNPESHSIRLQPDLFDDDRVRRILLVCPDKKHRLSIHPSAFRASRDYAKEVFIEGCDLRRIDFAFLKGFEVLKELYIHSSVLSSFEGLPAVPLRLLDIRHCGEHRHGFKWNVTRLPAELTVLRLDDNDLDDGTVTDIIRSASNSSLNNLILSNNRISRIPEGLATFATPLRRLKLVGNTIPYIDKESFRHLEEDDGSVHPSVLNLGRVSLNSIQPGTFNEGMDFVDCLIHLNDNYLTEFDAEVFQPVLEAMFKSNLVRPHRGAVFINCNPIRCDCNLSWLIRDRRHLMPFVRGASCANSTRFEDLNPYGFNHCSSEDSSNEVSIQLDDDYFANDS